MRFGVGLFPTGLAEETIGWARTADELGYDSVWVGDSQVIWRELYVLLGAIAVTTSRVKLGPCVTNPFTRHLTVTAGAMATLHDLSRKRALLGLGAGDSALKNLGKKRATLLSLENAIQTLRGLMRGEKLTLDNYPVRLEGLSGVEVPIYLAAGSPKMQELAGRVADGVVLGYWPEMGKGLARVMEGETKAGRSRGEVDVVLWTPCSISADPAEAFEAVKPQVARRLLSAAERGTLSEEELAMTEPLRKAYDFRHHMGPEHSSLVPDRLVARYAIAGTPEQARAKVEAILSVSGIDEIAIIPWGKNRQAVINAFAKEVIKPLRIPSRT
ncbi:MAG: LLM class flavin-dependent oxidoreductase [Deltaproteobacteria bacterium]|nr:LLM class flavin-dependent oxidoreductase [Deltaproteobacteria bacterium]